MKQADAAAPGAPPAGRWQFSMLQLLGATTGLAIVAAGAGALLRPATPARATLYAMMLAVGAGVFVGNCIRSVLRAMVAAISAALPAIGVVYLFSELGHSASSGSAHLGLLATTLLLAIPGATAPTRSADRSIGVWAVACVGLVMGYFVFDSFCPPPSAGQVAIFTPLWLLLALAIAALSYAVAATVGALAWALGTFGLALFDGVCALCMLLLGKTAQTGLHDDGFAGGHSGSDSR